MRLRDFNYLRVFVRQKCLLLYALSGELKVWKLAFVLMIQI